MDDERGAFLPPEPSGPEPELGGAPPRSSPSLGPAEPAPAPVHPQAPAKQPFGQQPPPGYTHAGWQQPPQPPPPWAYAPQQAQPDNGPAVAGFVLSLVAGALLFLSAGLSSVISVGCAIAGIVYSRKGKAKVASGETTRNAGLAQAGFIIGIVSLVLAVLATAVWAIVLVAAIADEDFRRDLENEFDSDSISASLRLGATAVRLIAAAGRLVA